MFVFDRRVSARLKFIEVLIWRNNPIGRDNELKPRTGLDSTSSYATNGKHRNVGSGRSGKAFRLGSALQKILKGDN